MGTFQEEQKVLIYWATLSGCYMPSIEKLISSKCVTKSLQCAVLIPTIGLIVLLGSSIKNLFWDDEDFLKKIYSFSFVINIFLMMFKCLYYNLNSQKFEKIFSLWDASFKEELFSERREELLRETKKITNRYINVLCSAGFFSCILWAVPPYFNPDKKLTHPTGFEYRNASPDYELIVTYELVVSLYSGTLGTVFDAVFMVLMSLEKTVLIHLQKCLAEIIDDIQVDSNGEITIKIGSTITYTEKPEQADINSYMLNKRKILLTWISHHQQLLQFHDEIQKIFHLPLCVIFSIIVFSICLLSFLNIVGALTTLETVVSIIFFSGNYCMFYFTCRFGDIINETSADLFQEAFSKAWYVYPKPMKTIFHIIIMRCQRPLDIVAYDIYPLGARSFYKIFKTAYTFFTMLMQLVKKRDFMKNKQHLTL